MSSFGGTDFSMSDTNISMFAVGGTKISMIGVTFDMATVALNGDNGSFGSDNGGFRDYASSFSSPGMFNCRERKRSVGAPAFRKRDPFSARRSHS